MLGETRPRLFTAPLCELTPDNSYGFDVIDFARDVLELPLDPWQEWLVIHAGELLPDDRPRFHKVLALVARQNGKTHLLKVLTLYWLFVERRKLVFGTSTTRELAKASWRAVVEMAQSNEVLAPLAKPPRLAIGEETFPTVDGCEYKFGASNRRGGRGESIHRLILDELREHTNRDAWDASVPATNAVPDAQIWAITNQGGDDGVVLESLREPAIKFIETGEGDPRLGLFEWSAPDGADPTDLHALAHSNPNLGTRIDPDALIGSAQRAKAAGGEELARFRTEIMCERVHLMDPAVDPTCWDESGTGGPVDLAAHRDRVALCVDVSLDGFHATLVAAAMVDGKVRVEVVDSWEGFGCTKLLRADLPRIVARVKPRSLGWFPTGPAAAVAADLAEKKGVRGWPPRGVVLEEIRADLTAVCMGLAEQVAGREIEHPQDVMLTQHVMSAQKLPRGDGWVFQRRKSSASNDEKPPPIDAAYALAGAVHLVRTLPPPKPPLVAL